MLLFKVEHRVQFQTIEIGLSHMRQGTLYYLIWSVLLGSFVHGYIGLTHTLPIIAQRNNFLRNRASWLLRDSLDNAFGCKTVSLPEVVEGDIKQFEFFLKNVTHALENNQGEALTLVSQNIEWLLSKDLPK
jgi:hypothetical protein